MTRSITAQISHTGLFGENNLSIKVCSEDLQLVFLHNKASWAVKLNRGPVYLKKNQFISDKVANFKTYDYTKVIF